MEGDQQFFTVSVCILNQWALDLAGNTRRILASIRQAKREGAKYRLGSELEICGYGCEDHFPESDLLDGCWKCLSKILVATLKDPDYKDIVCDVVLPVRWPTNGKIFNCRAIVLNGQILLLRPKIDLASNGLHFEPRWFAAWSSPWRLESIDLPEVITR